MARCSGSNVQAPPQVHLVDFPFLDLGHPGRGFWSPGCDCRLCRFSRGLGLVRRARHAGFHLVVRCAIDISSSQVMGPGLGPTQGAEPAPSPLPLFG